MNKVSLPWLHRVGHIGGKSKNTMTEDTRGQKADPWGGSDLGKFCPLAGVTHPQGESFNGMTSGCLLSLQDPGGGHTKSLHSVLCAAEVIVLSAESSHGHLPLLGPGNLAFPQFSIFLVMPRKLPGKRSSILELVTCACNVLSLIYTPRRKCGSSLPPP